MNKRSTTKEEYIAAVEESKSIADVCRKLGIAPIGGNYATIKRYIQEYSIDTSHFTGQAHNKGKERRPKIADLMLLLKENSYINSNGLKKRLIRSGYKQHKCEICLLYEWNGKPIPIELDHINGDRTDNRIENLRIICPNCHAQTDTYRGKNKISKRGEIGQTR